MSHFTSLSVLSGRRRCLYVSHVRRLSLVSKLTGSSPNISQLCSTNPLHFYFIIIVPAVSNFVLLHPLSFASLYQPDSTLALSGLNSVGILYREKPDCRSIYKLKRVSVILVRSII